MKKRIVWFCIFSVLCTLLFTGCGDDNLSPQEYASALVTSYDDYCKEFDRISEALSKGQNVTAGKLCDEASEMLDDMTELKAPKKLSDEHDSLKTICKNEKEKLSLQKELLEIISDGEENITDEQKTRIEEIKEKLSVLSVQSDKFEKLVYDLADKYLEKKDNKPVNLLDISQPEQ